MAYDPTTDTGYVRLLLSDIKEAPDQIFTDAEIAAFLAREGGPLRAAAQALDTIADNEALTSKVIRTQDLTTDGAKVADSLRARAKALRGQADDTDEGSDSYGFEIVGGYPTRPELANYARFRDGWLV